jgi:hypothetical protein
MVAGWRPVSQAEEAEARELFRRRNAHRRAAPQKIGSFWFGCCSPEEVCAREMRDPKLVKHHGVWTQMRRPIAGEEWESGGYTVSSLPDAVMLAREDRELCARILAKSPGRNRGRPSIGERAMTAAERKRRNRNQKAKTSLPRGRNAPGVVPMPLGPSPGVNFIVERNNMLLEKMARQQAEILARLHEILERLKSAPPDYCLTGEEFRILAEGAAAYDRKVH